LNDSGERLEWQAMNPPERHPRQDDEEKSTSFLLGVGLDSQEGERRVTYGDGFHLEGGSKETHGQMQEVVIHLQEQLKRRGRTIPEAEAEELRDLILEVRDSS